MRALLWIFFGIVPISAVADSYAGAHAKNSLGHRIYISEGDDYPVTNYMNVIKVYEKPRLESEEPNRFKFLNECRFTTEKEPYYFTCRKDGGSPLAGATYKITKSKKEKNGCGELWTIYLCVSGCDNERVPKVFYEPPWEC